MGRCGICLKKWTTISQHRTRQLLSGYFHIWKLQSHWKSIFAFHIFHFIKLFRRFESNCPGIFWDFQRNTKKKQHDGVYNYAACLISNKDVYLGIFLNFQSNQIRMQRWQATSKLLNIVFFKLFNHSFFLFAVSYVKSS